MARKKTTQTKQIRVTAEVAELAAIVAAYRRMEASDMLSEILLPILQDAHAEELRKLGVQPPPAPKRPKAKGE